MHSDLHPAWTDLADRANAVMASQPPAPHVNARRIRAAVEDVRDANNKVFAHVQKGTTGSTWFKRHIANAHTALDRLEAEFEYSRLAKELIAAKSA